MNERGIKLLAILCFCIGLASMWAYSSFVDQTGSTAQENLDCEDESSIGSMTTISGTVIRIDDKPKVHFLILSPTSLCPLVSFDPINAKPKDKVKVTGKIQSYKGKPEIIIQKVVKEN